MREIIKATLTIATLALSFASASTFAAESAPVKESEKVHPDAVRIYLIKNSHASLVALKDSELDKPPVLRRVGSAKTVEFQGEKYEVEYTLISRGGSTTVLDRYLPVDDDEE